MIAEFDGDKVAKFLRQKVAERAIALDQILWPGTEGSECVSAGICCGVLGIMLEDMMADGLIEADSVHEVTVADLLKALDSDGSGAEKKQAA